MYAEDHDLFRRAEELGWRAQFVADAEFVHLGGASSAQRWSDPARAERVARAEAAMGPRHLGAFRAALDDRTDGGGGRDPRGRGTPAGRPRNSASRGHSAWFRGYLGRG